MLVQDYIAIAAAVVALAVFLRWHLNPRNQFDLMDLICTDKRLNDKKFMRTGSWAVMTWGFYAMVEQGKDIVTYATLYGALWVGNAALDKWQRGNEQKGGSDARSTTA